MFEVYIGLSNCRFAFGFGFVYPGHPPKFLLVHWPGIYELRYLKGNYIGASG